MRPGRRHVTIDLLGHVDSHPDGTGSRFTSRYGVKMLVCNEPFADPEAAIQRERSLKHDVRQQKINPIEPENPHWADLDPALLARLGNLIVDTSGAMGPRDKRENDKR